MRVYRLHDLSFTVAGTQHDLPVRKPLQLVYEAISVQVHLTEQHLRVDFRVGTLPVLLHSIGCELALVLRVDLPECAQCLCRDIASHLSRCTTNLGAFAPETAHLINM